ncbi:NADH:flavin oxidoreductase/NADH oxidase family protein [Pseudomonas sp. o96-267]|uniref:NADH:flavin oxidoreductase/NADH oxidase family protein n=1 Tax=Pseudomonas sp. o96-267 TaxID=2479853 RepID=UPI000F774350|nr:NADH:flavin oxidoreductase/NADH oxidase family protein [Pseudomonas sp. o96-267]RRV25769.1 NADH:flavin oxidoreductase/NADH oxidase family protein [Pseudomonas sp. o96-267]
MNLFDPLALPNGSTIPNRIAKAAMEENMADADHAPSENLIRLYQAWAEGGAGLLISGNVMVDSRAMTGPGGVVLEDDAQLARFERWARVGRTRGAQFWLQINHPGRQMQANLGQSTWAPSAVALELGNLSKRFATPQEMTAAVIEEVIERFAHTARLGEQAGFTGVEIHAAHGYLLSQFLSPLSNQRNDQWGGSLENRARLLLEIVKGVRAVVSPSFAVAVKLNSADFQRGGFSAEDAQQVVRLLDGLGVDLVELSGGSYEAPAMQGQARDGRTLAREAYFLEFAREIRAVASMPIMVTGGIRRAPVAQQVLDSGIEMVGIGTALAIDPNLPRDWQLGLGSAPQLAPITWNNKVLASLANMAVVKYQLHQLSQGRDTQPGVSPLWALLKQQVKDLFRTRQYRRWMARRQSQ